MVGQIRIAVGIRCVDRKGDAVGEYRHENKPLERSEKVARERETSLVKENGGGGGRKKRSDLGLFRVMRKLFSSTFVSPPPPPPNLYRITRVFLLTFEF